MKAPANVVQEWGPMKRILFRFAFPYVVLYILPFPLIAIPGAEGVAVLYYSLWNAFVPWVGSHLLRITITVLPDCSGEGYQPEGGLIANLDKICIPVDVKVNLSSNCKTVILELHIQILADNSAQKIRIETNVFVKNQSVA
jgi:hypothetical protein